MRFSPTISAIIPLSVSATFQDRVYSFLRNLPVTRYMFRMFKKIELAQILQFQQPDVVFSPLHIEVLVFGKWKSVLSVHDLRETMPEFYDVEKARTLRINVLRSDAIVVAWKHPYNQLIETFPEQRAKTHLVPFPVPISRGNNQFGNCQSDQEIILFASALNKRTI